MIFNHLSLKLAAPKSLVFDTEHTGHWIRNCTHIFPLVVLIPGSQMEFRSTCQ